MKFPAGIAEIGQWYVNPETGEMFFVTVYDDKSRSIEVQSADGNISEIDSETWRALPLEACEQPEDYAEGADITNLSEPANPTAPIQEFLSR